VFIPGGILSQPWLSQPNGPRGEKEKGVAVIFDEAASVGRETWAAGVSM